MKVLVIEDDKSIIDTIALSFMVGWPGVELVSTAEGEEGIEMAESESPDIIILDIGLPDISGFEVLRQIRAFSNVPIVVLTAMTEESDVIKCLEWGADDFISKPFSKMELLARVKTKTRRQLSPGEKAPIIRGHLRYEPSSNKYYYGDKELNLTLTESEILYILMKESGKVVRHATLAEAIWGNEAENAANSLKVHIHHLRDKLKECNQNAEEDHNIQTWTGLGYSLDITGKSKSENHGEYA
jgi:two-component system KDP operon response regulator KdpE